MDVPEKYDPYHKTPEQRSGAWDLQRVSLGVNAALMIVRPVVGGILLMLGLILLVTVFGLVKDMIDEPGQLGTTLAAWQNELAPGLGAPVHGDAPLPESEPAQPAPEAVPADPETPAVAPAVMQPAPDPEFAEATTPAVAAEPGAEDAPATSISPADAARIKQEELARRLSALAESRRHAAPPTPARKPTVESDAADFIAFLREGGFGMGLAALVFFGLVAILTRIALGLVRGGITLLTAPVSAKPRKASDKYDPLDLQA